jgi:hypothetical protein
MKKTKRIVRHEEPSPESLRAIPEIDFTKGRRNPARAARVRKEGITLELEGQRPIVIRQGAGRPKRGEKAAPSAARTVRLPVVLWRALKVRAKRKGSTLNAELGEAAAEWLRDR